MIRAFVKNLLRRHGYEIAHAPNLGGFLRSRECDLMVDVGANVGQFAQRIRSMGFKGEILSIEPVAAVAAVLRTRANRDANWDVRRVGLGERPGSALINVSKNDVFSSILPLAPLAAKFENSGIESARTERIEIETLDHLLADHPSQRPFIKIDTQGFEQQVLAGGVKTLARCVGLLLEIPIDHLYEGVWTFPEAITHMHDLGFALAQISPVNCRADGDISSALEFDCVFRRA